MLENYLSIFDIGDESFKDRTSDYGLREKVIDYLNGVISAEEVREEGYSLRDAESLEGLNVSLNSQYSNYYVTVFNTYMVDDEWGVDIYGGDSSSVSMTQSIPYGDHDSFVIVISSVPWDALVNNPSLVDTEVLIVGGVAIQPHTEFGDIDIPEINPSDYVQTLTINGQTDISNVAVDRSDFMMGMIYDTPFDLTNGRIRPSGTVNSLELTLKTEYQHLYIAVFRVFEYMGYNIPYPMFIDGVDTRGSINLDLTEESPYSPITAEDFIFMVSPISFWEFESEEDYNTIVAFGMGFNYSEEEEEEEEEDIDLPPEIINPTDLDSTQYIQVLDGTTLEHYSYVPDVYNVKISQSINGQHTLSFNLQPYVNASNIYTPRIIECDGEYFHVQQITKRHHLDNLEMDVLCEHVSYELNYPHYSFWDEVAEEYIWTEDTYRGTASEILSELLQYNNRFNIGIVDNDMSEHIFTTSAEGFRTRINEFASYIGLEVRWNQFEVSLIRKRGRDHGTTLEVGKNIIALTEIIDTVKLGKVKRSYEIETIDLNYIYDASNAPIEMHNIVLGDVLTIVDDGYRIQRKDRVVSIERDPFQKALPVIEFVNNVETFTSDAVKNGKVKGVSTDGKKIEIYQENINRWDKANAFGYQTYAYSDYGFATGLYASASGDASFASGDSASAEGRASHATGYATRSRGTYSSAEGYWTYADGTASHSEGYGNYANGHYSHAEGFDTTADGDASHSEGGNTTASGMFSHSEGFGTTASGYSSHSAGFESTATKHSGFASGYNTVSSGYYSASFGRDTISNVAGSFVIGTGNRELNGRDDFSGISSNDVFVMGNGTAENRSNGLRVTYGGNMYVQGTYNTTGADYSEFFEWLDGNANNEDRKGYAVAFEGDKIRLANANDEYILGIVSVNPSIVGNSFEDQWNGMYITDEWGNIEHHCVDVPFAELDENGDIKTVYRQNYLPKINPNYNTEQTYIPRSQRAEWDAIGMLGKLLVRDDGTCKINKYAKLSETVDGVLTNSADRSQFFVLRRVSENIVEVVIK